MTLAVRVEEIVRGIEPVEFDDRGLVRRVSIKPEFSCFDGCVHGSERCKGRDSPGFHGVGHRRVIFEVSVAGRGGVEFDLSTPIYPEGVPGVPWSPLGPLLLHHADPGPEYLRDIGWSVEECRLTGGRCWNDVTYLQADKAVEVLLAGGVTGVWSWLGEVWLPDVIGAAS